MKVIKNEIKTQEFNKMLGFIQRIEMPELTSGICAFKKNKPIFFVGQPLKKSVNVYFGLYHTKFNKWQVGKIEDFCGVRELYLVSVDYFLEDYTSDKTLEMDCSECHFGKPAFLEDFITLYDFEESNFEFCLTFIFDPYFHDPTPWEGYKTQDFSWLIDVNEGSIRCISEPTLRPEFIAKFPVHYPE